jgi:hypothetical protein
MSSSSEKNVSAWIRERRPKPGTGSGYGVDPLIFEGRLLRLSYSSRDHLAVDVLDGAA